MLSKLRFGVVALVVGAAAGLAAGADKFDARYDAIIAARGQQPEAQRLHELFATDWAYMISVSPESATYLGYPDDETEWTDWSKEGFAARDVAGERSQRVLASIDRAALSPSDQLNYDIYQLSAENQRERARIPFPPVNTNGGLYLITQMDGIQQEPVELMRSMHAGTPAELEKQIARLRNLPVAVDTVRARLAEQLAAGLMPPQVILRDVPQQVLNVVPEDPFKSPLLAAFANLPASISGERAQELRIAAAAAYTEAVRPAYLRLHDFLTQTYVPRARATIAISDLPGGSDWYRYFVRVRTTTNLAPEDIHEIGLREVKRIRAEMERVKSEVGFKGTLAEFFTYLRTDPKFYYTDAAALLTGYRDIAKRIDPLLMKLFKTLPRTTYGVQAVPAYAEKSQTTAYYYPAAVEAGRPGYFVANTYALNTRPKWEMVPLTLHEAVPGHHLQISLAQELTDLPDFRRHAGFTAYVEGWALYSESLGEEMGLYTDPYDKFGQLTYEMWRAVRLVVDTGIHAKGWTREQAIQFFLDNAGKSEHDITVEVDRYIAWPGQALAYKLGELKIKELRAYATKELGPKFDLRLFHDEILRNGALPLNVLEEQVKAWVAQRKVGG